MAQKAPLSLAKPGKSGKGGVEVLGRQRSGCRACACGERQGRGGLWAARGGSVQGTERPAGR